MPESEVFPHLISAFRLLSQTKEAAAIAVKRVFRAIKSLEAQGSTANRTSGMLSDGASDTAVVAGDAQGEEGSRAQGERRIGLGRPLKGEELEGMAITMADFEGAISKVQPSIR